jgi:hypothetical protein
MEFQTGLNQFNGGYYNPQTQLNQFDYNNTGYNSYNTYDNSYQTNLNQFSGTYDHMSIHNHLHDGQYHVGDRYMNNDFVIRNQFDGGGNLMGGMPEVNPRF